MVLIRSLYVPQLWLYPRNWMTYFPPSFQNTSLGAYPWSYPEARSQTKEVTPELPFLSKVRYTFWKSHYLFEFDSGVAIWLEPYQDYTCIASRKHQLDPSKTESCYILIPCTNQEKLQTNCPRSNEYTKHHCRCKKSSSYNTLLCGSSVSSALYTSAGQKL